MKKILSFVILSFVLLMGFTECISKEPKKEEQLKVYAEDNIYGAEYVINSKISEELIEVNSNSLKIIKYEDEKTLINVANKKGIFKKGEIIFTIKNNTDNLDIQQKEIINAEKFKKIIKSVKSDSSILPILLGDFDKDGTVGLTDFITFKTAYGATTYDINYDIAPATKGTENWAMSLS